MQKPLYNVTRGTDSYKFTHFVQYPPGTTKVYSYFESRCPADSHDSIVCFGLQYFLKRYLEGKVVTQAEINKSAEMSMAHFGKNLYNREGWEYILNKHDGKLPIVIRAVPEGMVVPPNNVLMTIENTDPKCYWLTNWLETLLVQTWGMMTVATNSRACKEIIFSHLNATGTDTSDNLAFKLHDFGYRGVDCVESAATLGAAHLVSFKGTDTFAAVDMLREYYGAEMAGFSIPASEHSTITAWMKSGECNAFRNMLDQYPTGLVACVSDSYNIFDACKYHWGGELKDRVMGRNGTLVIRPDSGEPVSTVLKVLDTLGNTFGNKKNDKGYFILPPQVRIIQGDGIDRDMIQKILFAMRRSGWSADNIAFGSGGGLLQKFDRDTYKFAFKCSYIEVDGEGRDVFKDPVTDPGKISKKGRLALVLQDGRFVTVPDNSDVNGHLLTVFKDGRVLCNHRLEEIRQRAELDELK